MLACDVGLFAEVVFNVVELCVVDEAPAFGARGAFDVFVFVALSGVPAAAVKEELAVRPICFCVFQEWEK